MTASSRTRARAPWIALGLAIATAIAPLAPAFADEAGPSDPAASASAPASAPDAAEQPDASSEPTPSDEIEAPDSTDVVPEQTDTGASADDDFVDEQLEPDESIEPEPLEFRTRASFGASSAPVYGITVSPTDDLEAGDTVTVSGTFPSTVTFDVGASSGSSATTVLYLWFCSQPEGSTVGTAGGRATNTGRTDCAGSAQFVAPQAVPSAGVSSGIGEVDGGVWTFEKSFTLPADAIDGETCLEADAEGVQCSIFTRLNHQFNAGNLANPYVFDQYAHLAFAAPEPDYGITVSPTDELEAGDTVTVSGVFPATVTYDTGASAGTPATTALYLWFCAQPEGSTVGTSAGRATNTGRTDCAGSAQFVASAPIPMYGITEASGSVEGGVWSFEHELEIPADAIDGETCLNADAEGIQCSIFTRLFHGFHAGNLANPYIYDQYVDLGFAEPTTGGGGDDGEEGPGEEEPETGAPAPRLSATPSRISASGATTVTITGTGYTGAGAANGVYVNIGDADTWQPGQVPAEGGWVASTWVSSLSASGGFTTTLTVPAGSFSVGDEPGVASFAAHSLALTNRTLDAWLPLGIGGSGNASGSGAAGEPADTPPSDEGLELGSDTATEGGEVSITAGGFEPNEQNILVVIYSEPIVLDTQASADADGVVTWTGRLPAGLTGSHTLTLQGSIDVGAPIEIAPVALIGCTVETSSLRWGFKESFRAYIDGSIANGEWTTADGAEYATPNFRWTAGLGSFEPESSSGAVAFTGSVRFTGHSGALDTTIANPRIEFTAQGGTLLLDVTGTTQDGRELSKVGVEFATLDLSAATVTVGDGTLQVEAAPAVLTAAGSEVFGTYPEGEALDPVTFSLTGSPCEVEASPEAEEGADGGGEFPAWIIWLILGLAVLAAAVIGVILLLRRRAAA